MRDRNRRFLLLWLLVGGVGFGVYHATQTAPKIQIGVASVPLPQWKVAARSVGAAWLARGVLLRGVTTEGVDFSPDGKSVFSDGQLRRSPAKGGSGYLLQFLFWNAQTGAPLAPLSPSPPPLPEGLSARYPLYFLAPDDLVFATWHNVCRLNRQGQVRRRYFGRGTYRSMGCAGLSPDKKQLILIADIPFWPYSNPDDGQQIRARQLDLATGRLSLYLNGLGVSFHDNVVRLSPTRIAIKQMAYDLRVCDAQGKQLWSAKYQYIQDGYAELSLLDLRFDSTGKTLWILDSKQGVMRLDTRTWKQTRFCAAADFSALNLSPDGRFLLLSNKDGRLAIYNIRSRQQVRQALFPFSVRHLAWSPDGKRLALGGSAIVPFDVK